LGIIDVDWLLDNISSVRLTEWMAYYQLEPFGQDRDAINTGIIASTMANIHRSKGQKTYTPTDFVPEFGKSFGDREVTQPATIMESFKKLTKVSN